jgi:N-acetylneuraminic acid mutarotase
MTTASKWLLVVAVTLLSACGGGGGGGGSGNSGGSATTYQVSATAGTGGTISPANATVNAGGTTTLTVTASSGYVIGSVTGCGGTLSSNIFTTGTINASCAVTASFIAQYAVTATAGTGGTISPASATVNAGGATTLTVTASSGYAISSVTGCGGTLSGNTFTTGTINANCAVTASFIAQYAVTSTGGAGGTITPASATVNAGGTTTLTLVPKSGYVLTGATGCGGSLVGNLYTTGTINAACTVTASFVAAFTWVSGSSTTGASSVYGAQGVAASTNVPGARDASVTWTDASGNLWMFGGFTGYKSPRDQTGNFVNDLWEYSLASGLWTWVGGTQTACSPGVYGTQGVAAAANVPGGRTAAGSRWTDASGNFWMYGGGGCDSSGNFILYGDLWKYSPSTNQWTWVGGPSSPTPWPNPVYGTPGVADPANTPGARAAAAMWTDANGNAWMFGGFGFNSSGGAYQNDLWEYSPSTNEWTWIAGPSTQNDPGVYGTQGVAQASNNPSARNGALSWTDANGNVWLFGGYGYDSTGQKSMLNDLWEYSPSTGQWTWVGGPKTGNGTGVYGTQGVAAAANVPTPRDSAATWTDRSGNLWLFGGEGYLPVPGWFHRLNDLWMYSPSSGQWTWVAGSTTFDATGVYGTQGVAAVANIPGARAAVSSWTGTDGTLWLFGGYQYDDSTSTRFEMNDLWKYPTQ